MCSGGTDQVAPQSESTVALDKMEADASMSGSRSGEATPVPNAPTDQPKIEEKIIKDGNLTIEVKELNKAKSWVNGVISQHKAYLENENYYANDYESNYQLNIRVPSENFEAFIKALENGEGYIQAKNVSARSVTEEYIDITMRLANSRRYLDQYNQILKQAKSIKDILEVQEKIRVLEEEIEARQGRLNYLNDKVSLSTLNLTLTQKHAQNEHGKGFFAKSWDALAQGFRLLQDTLLFILTLWPYILAIGLILALRNRFKIRWPLRKK